MLDAVSMFSDDMMNLMLEDKPVPVDLLQATIRKACIARILTPVFCGSAYKNKGVQLLLDGVRAYLPSPLDRQYFGFDNEIKEKVEVFSDTSKPLIAMAFKIVDETFA